MAEVAEFPDCCGLKILNRFRGGHPGADPNSCMEPEDVDAFCSKHEKAYYGKIAGLMVILSEPQNERIGKVFRKRKWKLLQEVKNCRTGSNLYFYFRDLNPTVAREKRIFG